MLKNRLIDRETEERRGRDRDSDAIETRGTRDRVANQIVLTRIDALQQY